MSFIDSDGVHAGRPRRTAGRPFSAIQLEETVAHAHVLLCRCPGHSIESVNLKDPRLGVYEQCAELLAAARRRPRDASALSLDPGERHAGLTVDEYETLLMRHDLSEVLRDPVRFMAEMARAHLGNPAPFRPRRSTTRSTTSCACSTGWWMRSGLRESMVENVLSRAIAMPAVALPADEALASACSSPTARSRATASHRRRHLPEPDPGAVASRRRARSACSTSP